MSLSERAKQLKLEVPALFLALRHPGTPASAKVLAGIAVCYALSPIDLIPDFIPVLGALDDLLLLPLLIAFAVKRIPTPVLAECRAAAAGLWPGGQPKKWYYALPVAAVWLLLLGWAVKALWR